MRRSSDDLTIKQQMIIAMTPMIYVNLQALIYRFRHLELTEMQVFWHFLPSLLVAAAGSLLIAALFRYFSMDKSS